MKHMSTACVMMNSLGVDVEEMKKLFSEFGEVVDVGKDEQNYLVRYAHVESAFDAEVALDGYILGDKRLSVRARSDNGVDGRLIRGQRRRVVMLDRADDRSFSRSQQQNPPRPSATQQSNGRRYSRPGGDSRRASR